MTIQQEPESKLWIMSGPGLADAKPVTSGRGHSDGITGLAWTPDGRAAFQPIVSADSRWVFFYAVSSGRPVVYKVSIDGSEPVKVSGAYFRAFAVSPDGSLLLGSSWDAAGPRSAAATMPVEGGQPTLLRDVPPGIPTWTPDSRSITYARVQDGLLNIVSVTRTGGAPKTLLKLEDNIYAMAWSRDGRLALARGTGTSDVVLISRALSPKP